VVALSLARAVARAAAAVVFAGASFGAAAQFNMVPPPQCRAPAAAVSTSEEAYRVEAARHIYDCFPGRVYLGALPPLILGVMSIEAQIDAKGAIVAMSVVRKPAAEEIEPWVLAMLRRAAPFPAPTNVLGVQSPPGATVRWVETFFVDRSGLFQTLTLTEGQKGTPPVEAAAPLSASP
jgi:periplasmic protein TonB